MKSKKTLFTQTFLLSAFTFGGGYVIVPLMKKRFVDELGWLEEQEMLDIIALSQSAPGIIAINASILLGYRLFGVLGSFIAIFATALPPLMTISLVSVFYNAFKDNFFVNTLLKGMGVGVSAVIFDVVINMTKGIKKAFGLLVLCLAFFSAVFLKIDVIMILLASGFIGYLVQSRQLKSSAAKDTTEPNREDERDGKQ